MVAITSYLIHGFKGSLFVKFDRGNCKCVFGTVIDLGKELITDVDA
jgi:hypothetical protein